MNKTQNLTLVIDEEKEKKTEDHTLFLVDICVLCILEHVK